MLKLIVFLLILIFIYIAKGHDVRFHHSRIDTKYSWSGPHVNLIKYPLYMFSKYKVFTLKPGDCLYIPSNWWHWVFSRKENIAINVWFDGIDSPELTFNTPFLRKNTRFKNNSMDAYFLKENLKEKYPCGYRNVPNSYSYRRISEAYDNIKLERKSATFSDFISGIKPGKYGTFFAQDVEKELDLKKYIDIIPDNENIIRNLWFYDGDTNSGLHRDESENYLFQIKGEKKIFLFHPNYGKYLYADTVLAIVE